MLKRRLCLLPCAAMLALAGCNDGDTGPSISTTMQMVTTDAEGEESDTGASSSTGTGPLLDLGTDEGGPTGTDEGSDPPGCKKVDFLFIIDNSGSMSDEQDNLVASFDDFIASIDLAIDAAEQDYHILVTDTDAWQWEGCPLTCNLFPMQANCLANPQFDCGVPCMADTDCAGTAGDETCAGNGRCNGTQTVPLQCENIMGAGITHPRGPDASNIDCDFSSGARYLDSSEGAALVGKFSCAAKVGTGSTNEERPFDAMMAAVEEGSSAVATCNAGFLRDDAILVVTFITDESDDITSEDQGSSGSPQQWYDRIVAAKNGDPTAVVMLGIYGINGCGEYAPRQDDFIDLWGAQGLKGDICADSYGPFFQQAVDLIDTTCDGFIPPG